MLGQTANLFKKDPLYIITDQAEFKKSKAKKLFKSKTSPYLKKL